MDKEEILNKYRSENNDEGKNHENNHADDQGFYSLCFLALLIMMYQIFNNLPFGDITALLFAFMATGGFSRYRLRKEKGILYFSIVNSFLCAAFLIWYILQTI